jgi:hypothetical protein
MARKRLTDHYPPLDALKRTILKPRVSLAGARQFFAGEGLIVFADGKRGLAEVAGESYLPPGTHRQLAGFLDQNRSPSVVGFRLSSLPLPSEPMPELAQTPMQRFVAAARQTLHEPFTDQGREITLRAADTTDIPGWEWEGQLQYEHVFTLDGGQRIPEEACLRLYARTQGDDVDVALIVSQQQDREVAVAWVNKLIHGKWLPQPLVLPTRDPQRRLTIRSICSGFGARLSAVRSPDVYPTTTSEERKGFLAVLKRAAYETSPTDLETIVERTDSDAGILGSFTVTLWERSQQAVANIEVRQRPTEGFARVTWKGARAHDGSELDLSDRWWDSTTPVDWSSDRKELYLLGIWQDVVAGIDGAASADASIAATA